MNDPVHVTRDTPREVRALNEWSDVDRALLALRVCQVELETIGAVHDAQIQVHQEAKQKALAPIVARVERMQERLESFVTENRGQMDGQSVSLTHGRVGFRKTAAKVKLLRDAEQVLEMLALRNHDDCIAVTKKIDKKAVKDLPGGELAICGIHVHDGERFFVKLAKSPAVVYPDVLASSREES